MPSSSIIEPLTDSLAQLRTSTASIGEYFRGLCEELDELRDQLTHRHQDLSELDHALSLRREELQKRIDESESRQKELDHAKDLLAAEQQELDNRINADSDAASQVAVLKEQLENTEDQRLEAATEIDHLQGQIDGLQNQLHSKEVDAEFSRVDDVELQSRVNDLEEERRELEEELESVRSRAADLTELLDHQKISFSGEKAKWSEQLRMLEQRLNQHESLRNQGTQGSPPQLSGEVVPDEVQAQQFSNASPDPVLDTVMAQFEMLQKDMQKRRAKVHS